MTKEFPTTPEGETAEATKGWSDSDKDMAGKAGDSVKDAAKYVGDTAKSAGEKVGAGAKSFGETVKAHPYKAAAAVGGVAAAAAGAVVGKKYYDKRQEQKSEAGDTVDKGGSKPEFAESKAEAPEVAPKTN